MLCHEPSVRCRVTKCSPDGNPTVTFYGGTRAALRGPFLGDICCTSWVNVIKRLFKVEADLHLTLANTAGHTNWTMLSFCQLQAARCLLPDIWHRCQLQSIRYHLALWHLAFPEMRPKGKMPAISHRMTTLMTTKTNMCRTLLDLDSSMCKSTFKLALSELQCCSVSHAGVQEVTRALSPCWCISLLAVCNSACS